MKEATVEYGVIVLGRGCPGEHCAGALADGGVRVALVDRELTRGECSYYAGVPNLLRNLRRGGEVTLVCRRTGEENAGTRLNLRLGV